MLPIEVLIHKNLSKIIHFTIDLFDKENMPTI